MCHHFSRNYYIIRVMFWSFPYLLWQAFGHWSGFLAGVIVAVILTTMLDGLSRTGNWHKASSASQQFLQTAEPHARHQEEELYQHGYRAETEPYYAEPDPYQLGESQPQYEEMQVLYPQEEMPG